MITAEQIERFRTASAKLQTLNPSFGLRATLAEHEREALHHIISEVKTHTVLDYLAAHLYECADSCDGEGRDWILQQASTVSAAALFCKTWEPDR